MKKHVVRIAVYLALGAFVLCPFLHPYLRQCVFGPKIQDVPVWVWQQETRLRFGGRRPHMSKLEKIIWDVGIHHGPLRIPHFSFPNRDPEMLPILLSLDKDQDENVRWHVAYHLRAMPDEEETREALARLHKDAVASVREVAAVSLTRLQTRKAN